MKVYILVPVSKSIGTIVIAVRYNENLIPWKMLQIQEKISFLAETSQNFNLHMDKNILILDCVGVKKKGSREGENVFSFCK